MDFGSLELRHFRLVRAIVDEGSLTAAASRLAVSQPALSHQLRDIEDRLGVALFERSGRSLVLTEAGLLILGTARRVLEVVQQTEEDLAAMASGTSGTLRFATECYTTYHWLPEVVRHYSNLFPGVRVELAVEATERPGVALKAGTLDVGIVTITSDLDDSINLTPLFEDEVIVVVSEDHHWAGRSFVDPAEFEGEHVLSYQSGMERDCILGLVAAEGAAPSRITSTPLSTEAVIGMVRSNLGITTMAKWAATPYLERGDISTVSITEDGIHRIWYAATKGDTVTGFVDAFVDILTEINPANTPSRSSRDIAV